MRVGVAISGGGYRASAWGLGALLGLADVGAEDRATTVAEIASVSGGSLTNAWFGLQAGDQSGDEAAAGLAPLLAGRTAAFGAGLAAIALAAQLAWALQWWVGNGWVRLPIALAVMLVAALAVGPRAGDALFRSPVPWIYLVLLATVATGLVWIWWLPWSAGWRALAFAGGLVVLGAVLLLRPLVVDLAFRGVLRTGGRTARMANLDPGTQHVLCTTELHAGHHLYLLREDAYNHDVGLGDASRLPVATAVQLSANLPGAFPVRWLRTGPLGFAGGDQADARWLGLTDGGVYDNMADQWHLGFEGRSRRVPQAVADRWRDGHADLLVVANASAALQWRGLKRVWLPLAGELLGLLKVKDVLYDQTTSNRRRELVLRFDVGALTGTLVHIATNPWTLPRRFVRDEHPDDVRQRAAAALAALGDLGLDRDAWQEIARANAEVGTQLWPLGPDRVVRLLHHAYVQTVVHLHVLHGLPLPRPLPPPDAFVPLVEGRVRTGAGRRDP